MIPRRVAALWERLPEGKQRFLRFVIVGSLGALVNFAFVALGLWLFKGVDDDHTRKALASALGIGVSVISNFIFNDAWTWGDRQKGTGKADAAKRFGAYALGAGLGVALQYGTFLVLDAAFGLQGILVYLAQGLGIGVGMVANYVINNRIVFKDKAK